MSPLRRDLPIQFKSFPAIFGWFSAATLRFILVKSQSINQSLCFYPSARRSLEKPAHCFRVDITTQSETKDHRDGRVSYDFASVTISEKSAIVENSFSKVRSKANRFARTRRSSTITITLSKKLSIGSRAVARSSNASKYCLPARSASTP